VLSHVYSLWFSKRTGGQCPDTTSWTASLIAWCTHAEIPSILTGVHCVCAHHGKELWELLLSLALLYVRHSTPIGSCSASTGRVWVSAPAAALVEAHVRTREQIRTFGAIPPTIGCAWRGHHLRGRWPVPCARGEAITCVGGGPCRVQKVRVRVARPSPAWAVARAVCRR
jgi:hypothetical protein